MPVIDLFTVALRPVFKFSLFLFLSIHPSVRPSVYVCMYVRMYICMYVHTYVCMYVDVLIKLKIALIPVRAPVAENRKGQKLRDVSSEL
jgi:hypothetical protein